MEFGIQFFPSVGPDIKPADQYWQEALHLVRVAEELGFSTVRTVEHYFHYYGGYSPNPIVFLSAAAAVTKKMRVITGAVLPIFNNPLKLAGEIGMLDAISGGRAEIGFARAFLPREFAGFGRPLDESRARFEEGMDQVRQLLEAENVTANGSFHSFKNITSLPRPTQKPRPQFWVAALATPETFEAAGRDGHHMMAIPLTGHKMRELLEVYRNAWRAAGRTGQGKAMLAFHMYCDESRAKAMAVAKRPMDRYLQSIVAGAAGWAEGLSSKDYPGYEKMIAGLSAETLESTVEKGGAWVGAPDDIIEQIASYQKFVGGYEAASLQVNFGDLAVDVAEASMRLFAKEVMPRFRD